MNDLENTLLVRKSIRKYTGEPIAKEQIDALLTAALSSASGHAFFPLEYIVVTDREMLRAMKGSRVGSANMLEDAACAIVVLGNDGKSDTWVEDASIAMANMMLAATSLGLGSCWIQGRAREAVDGRTSEEYLRGLLGFPQKLRLEATLSVGVPCENDAPRTADVLQKRAKIHTGRYEG